MILPSPPPSRPSETRQIGVRPHKVKLVVLFALIASLALFQFDPAKSDEQTRYTYDALGRLVGVAAGERATAYTYDLAGNRTQVTTLDTLIVGTSAAETLYGTNWSDHISALDGDDWIDAGDGNDVILGGPGWDAVALSGVLANYTLSLNPNYSLQVSGPPGVSQLTSVEALWFAGDDQYYEVRNLIAAMTTGGTFTGTADDDVFEGTAGADHFIALAGNDYFTPNGGNDILDGGPDWDTAYYPGGYADYTFALDLNGDVVITGTMSGSDTLIGMDQLWFFGAEEAGYLVDILASLTDTPITGTSGMDDLYGTVGDDLINALGDDDWINGAAGNDTIDGGDGWDVSKYPGALSDCSFSLDLSSNFIMDCPSEGVDALINIEAVYFWGEDGYYAVYDLIGTLSGGTITGTSGADDLYGTAAGDAISMLAGDDWAEGYGGDDTMDGGDGWDAATYPGALAACTYIKNLDGSLTLTCPGLGTDTLINVEGLWFGGEEVYYSIWELP